MESTKPLLLFDLNGTLIQRVPYVAVRTRPGALEALQSLRKYFRLGVFSSMAPHNVQGNVEILEATSWQHVGAPLELDLVLDRRHCKLLSQEPGNNEVRFHTFASSAVLAHPSFKQVIFL